MYNELVCGIDCGLNNTAICIIDKDFNIISYNVFHSMKLIESIRSNIRKLDKINHTKTKMLKRDEPPKLVDEDYRADQLTDYLMDIFKSYKDRNIIFISESITGFGINPRQQIRAYSILKTCGRVNNIDIIIETPREISKSIGISNAMKTSEKKRFTMSTVKSLYPSLSSMKIKDLEHLSDAIIMARYGVTNYLINNSNK